jgi:hypothetical protein
MIRSWNATAAARRSQLRGPVCTWPKFLARMAAGLIGRGKA